MAKRRARIGPRPDAERNLVSEWFGHRVFPTVAASPEVLADQSSGRCPFLSRATGETRPCIKSANSLGICTISSNSNGLRQDWLVCPYRAVEQHLLDAVVRRLYGDAPRHDILVVPVPALASEEVRVRVREVVARDGFACVFFESKLGGELSVSATERSPELAFDFTLIPLWRGPQAQIRLGRHAILEIQTMDFHGTYEAVATNLRDARRLHGAAFHETLASNQRWLSQGIEGPNIANVFKRTFYQMMLKFQIGADEATQGCVLAVPVSVWDSWQRHLARPPVQEEADGTFSLWPPGTGRPDKVPAWIFVFDIDTASQTSPAPLVIRKLIATSAEALSHFALTEAPRYAVAGAGEADAFVQTIRRRLKRWWPELASVPLAERPSDR